MYKERVVSVINYSNKLVVKNTHKINSRYPDYKKKISICKIAPRFSNTVGVKSRRILKGVVAGIAKKFDAFVLI